MIYALILQPAPPTDPIPLWLYVVLFLLFITASSGASWLTARLAVKRAPFDVRKTQGEIDKDKADYAQSLREITADVSAENKQLRIDYTAMRNEFDTYKKQARAENERLQALIEEKNREYAGNLIIVQTKYESIVADLKEAHGKELDQIKKSLQIVTGEATKWRDYSVRLINQMKAEMPDVTPVSLEPRKRGDTCPRNEE